MKDPELHPVLEKLYWKIEPYLKQIDFIAVNEGSKEVVLISDKVKEIEKLWKDKSINLRVFSKNDAERLIKQHKGPFSSINKLSIIYDLHDISVAKTGGDN